ncbi:MAG: hypothetical protein OXF79_17035 [Chloroflexi bacterium]|nr:hypothetical protein [Chloroflexota bacterium]
MAISLGEGTLLRECDRHVALLLAMTKWVRASINLTLPRLARNDIEQNLMALDVGALLAMPKRGRRVHTVL